MADSLTVTNKLQRVTMVNKQRGLEVSLNKANINKVNINKTNINKVILNEFIKTQSQHEPGHSQQGHNFYSEANHAFLRILLTQGS